MPEGWRYREEAVEWGQGGVGEALAGLSKLAAILSPGGVMVVVGGQGGRLSPSEGMRTGQQRM